MTDKGTWKKNGVTKLIKTGNYRYLFSPISRYNISNVCFRFRFRFRIFLVRKWDKMDKTFTNYEMQCLPKN